jgi:hypothetical protein
MAVGLMAEHPWGEVVAAVSLCADPASDGIVFTCADLADSIRRFACTGGYHVGTGQWIRCTCRCHEFDSSPAGVVPA